MSGTPKGFRFDQPHGVSDGPHWWLTFHSGSNTTSVFPFVLDRVTATFLACAERSHQFLTGLAYVVEECLSEAQKQESVPWASGNNYGTMPNWDTSLVTDMSGWTGSAFQGFGDKSTFDGDISKWDTGKVTKMSMFSSFCVQPRHWELEHRKSD